MAQENSPYIELGVTGLNTSGGRVYEEPNWRLSAFEWRRACRDMLANDPTVNAIFFTFDMLMRQATWKILPFSETEPKDVEQGDFIRECLFSDMSQTWQETLSEINTFLPWGWSWLEMCFKERRGESLDKTKNSKYADGKIGLRKLAIRAQESLQHWDFDEFGEVAAMVQMPAPDYRLRRIPVEKSLHFRTSSIKNNPEGHALTRRMYRPWYIKSNIENIEAIGVERDLAGFPVAFVPPALLTSNDPNDIQIRNALKELVQGIKRNEKEGALFPREFDGNAKLPVYDLQLLSTGGQRQFDTSKIIERYDQRILMSVMADFLMLGTKSGGSYSLSEDKSDLFSNALSSFMDNICETINRQCIPQLYRLNGLDADRPARLAHGGVQQISLEQLGAFIAQMAGAGMMFDENQQNWTKRRVDMPITEKDHK